MQVAEAWGGGDQGAAPFSRDPGGSTPLDAKQVRSFARWVDQWMDVNTFLASYFFLPKEETSKIAQQARMECKKIK